MRSRLERRPGSARPPRPASRRPVGHARRRRGGRPRSRRRRARGRRRRGRRARRVAISPAVEQPMSGTSPGVDAGEQRLRGRTRRRRRRSSRRASGATRERGGAGLGPAVAESVRGRSADSHPAFSHRSDDRPERSRLTVGAPERRTSADRGTFDRGAATRARCAALAVRDEVAGVHAALADGVAGGGAQDAPQVVELLRRSARPRRGAGRAAPATASRRPAGCRRPAIERWSSSRAFSAIDPRPTRSRNMSRETTAASGPTWSKSGLISARPSRRLSCSAIRLPSANSSTKRSQRSCGSLVDHDPARPCPGAARARARRRSRPTGTCRGGAPS